MPAIKALLLTVFVGCLILFLSSSTSELPTYDRENSLKLQAGVPSPWFVFERYPDGHIYRIVAFSWSWAIVALGALACWLYGVIRKVETGGRPTKLDRFVSRGFLLWGWIVVFALGAYSLEALWLDMTLSPTPYSPRPVVTAPVVKSMSEFAPRIPEITKSGKIRIMKSVSGSPPTIRAKGVVPGLEERESGASRQGTVGPEQDSRRVP
jgi:hypothetical protein